MGKTAKEKRASEFGKKYLQVSLHNEIYPNDSISRQFFLVTKQELKRLNKLTDNRVRLYNKKYRPANWAKYE